MASLADLAGYSSDGSSPSKGQIDDTIADGDNRTKETVSSVIVNETSFSTSGDQVTEQKTTEVAETLVESGVDGSENSDASTTKRRRQSFLEKIPPPSSEAVSKIMVNIVQDYIDAKNCEGFDLTESIRSKKDFGNPYILQKVVDHFSIVQTGSNYPTDIFDPTSYDKTDYISKIMKGILPTSAGVESFQEGTPSKKSKWDSASTVNASNTAAVSGINQFGNVGTVQYSAEIAAVAAAIKASRNK